MRVRVVAPFPPTAPSEAWCAGGRGSFSFDREWVPGRGIPASSADAFLALRPVDASVMVTFDKGARVARLEAGATLDARQVGILVSQTGPGGPGGSIATLTGWDHATNAATAQRIEGRLAQKGPTDKGTLLLALSMGVLQGFDLRPGNGTVVHLRGDRVRGFTVVGIDPLG